LRYSYLLTNLIHIRDLQGQFVVIVGGELVVDVCDGVGEGEPQQGEDPQLDHHRHHSDEDILAQPQQVVLQCDSCQRCD
jgi:hypothetical protein